MASSSHEEPPPENPPENPSGNPPGKRRTDASPWNLLLIPPMLIPLLTFLFNSDSPRVAGFPAFYWIQFLFIPLGVTCTAIVYRMTRGRG